MALLYLITLLLTTVSAHHIERAIVGGSVTLSCCLNINDNIGWRTQTLESTTAKFIIHMNTFTSTYINRTYVSYSYYYNYLTITNLTLLDARHYWCEHMLGPNRCNKTELIIVDPSSINYTLNVTVGDNVELPCPFQATNWSVLRNGALVPLYTNIIDKISIDNGGVYFCFRHKSMHGIRLVVDNIPVTSTLQSGTTEQSIPATMLQKTAYPISIYISIALAISNVVTVVVAIIVYCKKYTLLHAID